MKGERSCELLDEDRFSAPNGFREEEEEEEEVERYEYLNLKREYKKPVSNDIIRARIIR